jgi:uncharacterized membrane protein YidH (DUF202 family)
MAESLRGGRGLQAERTMLSWDRTTLGILANGALGFFQHAEHGGAPSLAIAAAALAVVVICVVARLTRGPALRGAGRRRLHPAPARRQVRWLGSAVSLLSVANVVLIAADPAAL